MVQVVPPDGWVLRTRGLQPAGGHGQDGRATPYGRSGPATLGPPPLDRVAVSDLPLELEPAESGLFLRLFGSRQVAGGLWRPWLLGACTVAVLAASCALWYAVAHRATPDTGPAKRQGIASSLDRKPAADASPRPMNMKIVARCGVRIPRRAAGTSGVRRSGSGDVRSKSRATGARRGCQQPPCGQGRETRRLEGSDGCRALEIVLADRAWEATGADRLYGGVARTGQAADRQFECAGWH